MNIGTVKSLQTANRLSGTETYFKDFPQTGEPVGKPISSFTLIGNQFVPFENCVLRSPDVESPSWIHGPLRCRAHSDIADTYRGGASAIFIIKALHFNIHCHLLFFHRSPFKMHFWKLLCSVRPRATPEQGPLGKDVFPRTDPSAATFSTPAPSPALGWHFMTNLCSRPGSRVSRQSANINLF